MEYKILESPGVEIDNIDGAAFNDFSAGHKNGIIPGILDGCVVTQPSSNSIMISTGALLINGFRVKIITPYYYSFNSSAAVSINYHLIAQIILKSDKTVFFDILCREVGALIQDNLYQTGTGTYQIELAQFLYLGTTISELERTVFPITTTVSSEVSYRLNQTARNSTQNHNKMEIHKLNSVLWIIDNSSYNFEGSPTTEKKAAFQFDLPKEVSKALSDVNGVYGNSGIIGYSPALYENSDNSIHNCYAFVERLSTGVEHDSYQLCYAGLEALNESFCRFYLKMPLILIEP